MAEIEAEDSTIKNLQDQISSLKNELKEYGDIPGIGGILGKMSSVSLMLGAADRMDKDAPLLQNITSASMLVSTVPGVGQSNAAKIVSGILGYLGLGELLLNKTSDVSMVDMKDPEVRAQVAEKLKNTAASTKEKAGGLLGDFITAVAGEGFLNKMKEQAAQLKDNISGAISVAGVDLEALGIKNGGSQVSTAGKKPPKVEVPTP